MLFQRYRKSGHCPLSAVLHVKIGMSRPAIDSIAVKLMPLKKRMVAVPWISILVRSVATMLSVLI